MPTACTNSVNTNKCLRYLWCKKWKNFRKIFAKKIFWWPLWGVSHDNFWTLKTPSESRDSEFSDGVRKRGGVLYEKGFKKRFEKKILKFFDFETFSENGKFDQLPTGAELWAAAAILADKIWQLLRGVRNPCVQRFVRNESFSGKIFFFKNFQMGLTRKGGGLGVILDLLPNCTAILYKMSPISTL